MSRSDQDQPREPMPPVWRGRRRRLLVSLVVLGLLQAAFALAMALSVGRLLAAPGVDWPLTLLLVLAVTGIGLGRWLERIVAEDLGQDYVYEQRRRLIASALVGRSAQRSLGVVVTRASNDLTSVRNWIAQGIVPLLTGVPLILVVVAGVFLMNHLVGMAVAVPLLVMTGVLPQLSALAYNRSRRLRKRRGRMSAHIADTVRAGESVRAAGAIARELNAVDRNSARVVGAAVDRARITGLIRALTVTAASLCTVAVVLLSMYGLVDSAGVASVMTLLGVLATPMSDLGRVVEYRQNYKAARRILAPILAEADQLRAVEKEREKAWSDGRVRTEDGHRGLRVTDLQDAGRPVPDLDAGPRARVHLAARRTDTVRDVLGALVSRFPAESEPSSSVLVDGEPLLCAPVKHRRSLVGFASEHIPLERGSVRRLISYRHPDAEDADLDQVVQAVGLAPRLADEPKGTGLKLSNDGSPFSAADVARVKLARAVLGRPQVLVLEDMDASLDAAGLEMLRELIADYPGTVLFSTRSPERLASGWTTWDLDALVEDDDDHAAARRREAQQADDDDE